MSEWSEEPTPRRVRSPRRRRQQQVAPAEPATEDTALREQKCRDREIACAEREVACAEREVACADRELYCQTRTRFFAAPSAQP